MPSTDRPESGFLVLADISGFTAFVTATELEHGARELAQTRSGLLSASHPDVTTTRSTRNR